MLRKHWPVALSVLLGAGLAIAHGSSVSQPGFAGTYTGDTTFTGNMAVTGTGQFGGDVTLTGTTSTNTITCSSPDGITTSSIASCSYNTPAIAATDLGYNWKINGTSKATLNASGLFAVQDAVTSVAGFGPDVGYTSALIFGRASDAAAGNGIHFSNNTALSALDDRFVATFWRDALFNAVARVSAAGTFIPGGQSLTIADSGGAGAATSTATPIGGAYDITCNDADGCDFTLDRKSVV